MLSAGGSNYAHIQTAVTVIQPSGYILMDDLTGAIKKVRNPREKPLSHNQCIYIVHNLMPWAS